MKKPTLLQKFRAYRSCHPLHLEKSEKSFLSSVYEDEKRLNMIKAGQSLANHVHGPKIEEILRWAIQFVVTNERNLINMFLELAMKLKTYEVHFIQGGEDITSVQKKVAAIKVKDGIVNGNSSGVNTGGPQTSNRFNTSTSTSQSLVDHLPTTKTVLKANSLAQQLEGMKTAGTEHFIKNVVIEPPTGSRPSRQNSRQATSGGGNSAGLEPSRPNQARRSNVAPRANRSIRSSSTSIGENKESSITSGKDSSETSDYVNEEFEDMLVEGGGEESPVLDHIPETAEAESDTTHEVVEDEQQQQLSNKPPTQSVQLMQPLQPEVDIEAESSADSLPEGLTVAVTTLSQPPSVTPTPRAAASLVFPETSALGEVGSLTEPSNHHGSTAKMIPHPPPVSSSPSPSSKPVRTTSARPNILHKAATNKKTNKTETSSPQKPGEQDNRKNSAVKASRKSRKNKGRVQIADSAKPTKYSSTKMDGTENEGVLVYEQQKRTQEMFLRSMKFTLNLYHKTTEKYQQLTDKAQKKLRRTDHYGHRLLAECEDYAHVHSLAQRQAIELWEGKQFNRMKDMEIKVHHFSPDFDPTSGNRSISAEEELRKLRLLANQAKEVSQVKLLYEVKWYSQATTRLRDYMKRMNNGAPLCCLKFLLVLKYILVLGFAITVDIFHHILLSEIFMEEDFRKNIVNQIIDVVRIGLEIASEDFLSFLESNRIQPSPELLNEIRLLNSQKSPLLSGTNKYRLSSNPGNVSTNSSTTPVKPSTSEEESDPALPTKVKVESKVTFAENIEVIAPKVGLLVNDN
eukprot:gene777-842_t